MNNYKKISLLIYLSFWIIFCLKPIYPNEMVLQHSATLVVFLLLVWISFKGKLSDTSIASLCLFMILHIIAARWIYSYVPYNEWSKIFFSAGINDVMGWKRNNFDRFIHFAYGFLFTYPFAEIFAKIYKTTILKSLFISLLFILGSSAIYEIFEWYISLTLSPQDTENYNGQQGDIWDPQKDITLAFIGSIIMSFITYIIILFKYKYAKASPN